MNIDLEATRQAEMSVIGAILIDEKYLATVIDIVKAEDFYFDDIRMSYQAILELSNEGKRIDYVTVLNKVALRNIGYDIDFKKLLLECTDITPSVSNTPYYAKLISNSARARKLFEVVQTVVMSGITSENVYETSDYLVSQNYEIMKTGVNERSEKIENIVSDIFEENKSEQENLSNTGFPKFDGILNGMSAGNLIILASRPKVGKTAFALQVARNVAKTGKKVIIYSQEMLKRELGERFIAGNSEISMNTLINKNFKNKSEIEKIKSKVLNYPIVINDFSSISAQNIRLECKMIKNIGLIIVDYLQLMKSTKKSENRNQEIGQISRDLKCLATDLNVPILCLSQLNRVSDENKRPNSSELRDSGSIEQDANKVILMWCVEKHLGDNGIVISKTIGIDVALNRRGATGVTLMNFDGNHMTFTELEKRYEEKENFDWRNRVF